MQELRRRLPGLSKTGAIEHAIAEFLSWHTVRELTGLAGTLDVDDVSVELRSHDRAS